MLNLRIGTESEFTTINETLKEWFICLYSDKLTFTGWSYDLGDIFSNFLTGIALHWAPVSILLGIGVASEDEEIFQLEGVHFWFEKC